MHSSSMNSADEERPLLEASTQEEASSQEVHVKVDCRRWLVMAIIWASMLSINLSWITFSPVADIAACYYGVTLPYVNLLSWVTSVVYLVGFVPSSWFMNKCGIKTTIVLAGCIGCAAGWLKFAGTGPNLYWLLFGSTLANAAQYVLIAPSVTKISGSWFPPSERALSTGVMGSLGSQVGLLMGVFLSPVVVTSEGFVEACNENVSRSSEEFNDWQEYVQGRLSYYLLAQATCGTLLFLATLALPNAPKVTPTVSRSNDITRNTPFFSSYLKVIRNPYFITCFVVFGMFPGSETAFVTVYDEVLVHAGYVSDQKYASYLGIAMQLSASSAVLAVSKWIDSTKSYRVTSLTIAAGCALAVSSLAILVRLHSAYWLLCITVVVARGMIGSFNPVGAEYGAEITHPAVESISYGLMQGFTHVWSPLLTLIGGYLIEYEMSFICIVIYAGIFLLATIALALLRPELRRLKHELGEEDVWKTCCCITFYKRSPTWKIR